MNFEFSDEQNLLREQAAGFLGDNCPPSAVRAILEGDASFDADLWKQIAELGLDGDDDSRGPRRARTVLS